MERIALQILEDGWDQDGRSMRRAVGILRERLAESTDGRWAAAAFEINRIYNILEMIAEAPLNGLSLSSLDHSHATVSRSPRRRRPCPRRLRGRSARQEKDHQT